MQYTKKITYFLYIIATISIPIFIILQNENEPILIGTKCDLKNVFLVKYCEDDKKTISIVKRITGSLEGDDLKLKEKEEEHKSHKITEKLMCLKFAYGCPSCKYWARSFSEGVCKYCGRKLIKSKYWSPIITVFDKKICFFSGIFPHITE